MEYLSENEKRAFKTKAGDFALEVAGLSDSLTGYSNSIQNKLVSKNPFNDFPNDAPYIMDSASFVYWVYDKVGYPLDMHVLSMKQLPYATNLEPVATIGANYNPELIEYGDLVFFSKDRLVGFYTGHYQFTGFIGNGKDNMSKGVSTKDFREGLFNELYEGHVMRIR